MRLINVYTLDIETFDQPDAKYAILSHRWSNSEVKFSDYVSAKSLIGHQISREQTDDPATGVAKIAKACLQSRNLGLNYLWIDTCCIDKRSSSEESESINSMFNWYSEAEICLAYLADVAHNSPYKSFSDSVWFTRGWTLQELLAPRNVVFFDRDWMEIGTKTSLSPEIEKATRISHKHMLDFRTASIATKMSWQAHRTTTRTEDLAYSMFGIFDIGMDLRYGEREKAFRRLQEEIINANPLDESILAWTSTEPSSGILAPRPDCFRDSGDLTVTSPFHKYQPRTVYRISNRGLEISIAVITSQWTYMNPLKQTAIFHLGKYVKKNVDLTLNCWKVGKEGPSTVVIHLEKDDRGFFYRTNCDKLDWTKAVSRPKVPLGTRLDPSIATTPIAVQL